LDRFADRLPMPAAYFELVLREFARTQSDLDAIVAGTGVTAAQIARPGAEITFGQQLQQLRNVSQRLPAGWALSLAPMLHASTHGALGFAVVSSPTLRNGLDLLARYVHVRNPSHRGRAEVRGSEYRLALIEQVALLDEERALVQETLLLGIQGLVETVLARPACGLRIEFSYPAPAWAQRHREVFHGSVHFEAPQTALVVPVTLLGVRSPHADPACHAAVLPTLEILSRRVDGLDASAPQVEQLLVQAGDTPLPLVEAARRLGVSRRTLLRRLGESGTSYRDLVDAHRRRRAEALLREGLQTVSEVGFRLGYKDAANFARACRRWFGVAPGELRHQSRVESELSSTAQPSQPT
jgi:AraC-like DNA-binding protein